MTAVLLVRSIFNRFFHGKRRISSGKPIKLQLVLERRLAVLRMKRERLATRQMSVLLEMAEIGEALNELNPEPTEFIADAVPSKTGTCDMDWDI